MINCLETINSQSKRSNLWRKNLDFMTRVFKSSRQEQEAMEKWVMMNNRGGRLIYFHRISNTSPRKIFSLLRKIEDCKTDLIA